MTLREQIEAIVTRDGKSVRIPELLEIELDALEHLLSSEIRKAQVDELDRVYRIQSSTLSGSVKLKTWYYDRVKALETPSPTALQQEAEG